MDDLLDKKRKHQFVTAIEPLMLKLMFTKELESKPKKKGEIETNLWVCLSPLISNMVDYKF